MRKIAPMRGVSRRALLRTISALPLAAGFIAPRQGLAAAAERDAGEADLVQRLIGQAAIESPLVRLDIPPVFANGHSVPLTVSVDSPMSEMDYVLQVHILAPKNPILTVARFQFTPRSGRAVVSTRIRLAEPQNVLAIAQMSTGGALMARAWVQVEENGCPTN